MQPNLIVWHLIPKTKKIAHLKYVYNVQIQNGGTLNVYGSQLRIIAAKASSYKQTSCMFCFSETTALKYVFPYFIVLGKNLVVNIKPFFWVDQGFVFFERPIK